MPFSHPTEEAHAKIKQERDKSPEGLFVAQDDEPETATRTTVSSGPYAGLKSAKKRVHETTDPKENPTSSFGPAKKIVKKGNGLKNVQVVRRLTLEISQTKIANPNQQSNN